MNWLACTKCYLQVAQAAGFSSSCFNTKLWEESPKDNLKLSVKRYSTKPRPPSSLYFQTPSPEPPSQRWRPPPPPGTAPHKDGAGRADVAEPGLASGERALCACAAPGGLGTMGRRREGLSVAREVRGGRRPRGDVGRYEAAEHPQGPR